MVDFKLDWTIIVISSFVVLIPLYVGFVRQKILSTSLRVVFMYVAVATFFEILSWVMVLNHYQNHWVHNLFNIFEFGFWGYYFTRIYKNQTIVKIATRLCIGIIIIVLGITFIDLKSLNIYNSIAYITTCFILIALVLYHFYELLNYLSISKLSISSQFWISAGVLLYFSGCFFTDLFSEIILFSKDKSLNKMWLINYILLFIFRIFLAIGLWFSKTPPQLSPSSK
jgi:hypothetical protein